MKFVLAAYGSRGDVEPCLAVGRELQRRGHDVRMAAPPNMLAFAESVGLAATAYGPDTAWLGDEHRAMFESPNPISVMPQVLEYVMSVWADKTEALATLAGGADLLVATVSEQGLAANVAEHHGIPVAGLHPFPPGTLPVGSLDTSMTRAADEAQRRSLCLPGERETTGYPLEIQTYDEICLPGLAAQWAQRAGRRPFVGALTLASPTAADDDVLAWCSDGTPPIYFGLGATPVTSFPETVALVSAACAEMGERLVICSGPNDVSEVPYEDHVKVVSAINHSAILSACRAVVHHGGAGTTAAGLRAGIPTLILWLRLDQPLWAAVVEELGVGSGRCFLSVTRESLVDDLRSVLTPNCADRAREVAAQMARSHESATAAADLLEQAARDGCFA